jgi:ubiquinone/menaquinone biosynthesis C-methylase UbiE
MPHRVCPWWLGYWLLNPLRRLREDPGAMLGPWVREGMTVLEPGCGMGFFTLEIARRVGAAGRVVAVDVQERMLRRLRARALRAGVADRVDARLATEAGLGLADLAGTVDLTVAIHVVHEVPDAAPFFTEIHAVSRPRAALVVIEPAFHVTEAELDIELAAASVAGFELVRRPLPGHPRSAELVRR